MTLKDLSLLPHSVFKTTLNIWRIRYIVLDLFRLEYNKSLFRKYLRTALLLLDTPLLIELLLFCIFLHHALCTSFHIWGSYGKGYKALCDLGSWFRERHMIHPQPMKHTEMPLGILQRRLTFSWTWMWEGLSSRDVVTHYSPMWLWAEGQGIRRQSQTGSMICCEFLITLYLFGTINSIDT